MDYPKFETYLKTEIPLNRKEKFFTATILPSILFHDGFSNFFQFLHLIKNFPKNVNEANTVENFLFYTEYNLKQSAGKRNVGIQIKTRTGETPDILIEILRPLKLIVVIEAKMFQNYPQTEFDQQMDGQKNAIIRPIQEKIGLSNDQIFHIGLVPEKLGYKSRNDYQIINWEIFNSDIFRTKGNFFINYLRFALNHYPFLVEKRSMGKASTVKKEIKGTEIYKSAKNGDSFWVGRQGGKQKIEKDAKDGSWRKRKYSWNDVFPQNGIEGNWIAGKDFALIIERNQK